MDEQLYVVHWKHKTGHTGKSVWAYPKEEAQRIADGNNRDYTDVGYTHWIEPVEKVNHETPTP